MSQIDLSLASIRAAHEAIRTHVRHTPLEAAPGLDADDAAQVHLKLECFQVTGSFKPRGAFTRLLALDPAQRRAGVIASTAGNHGVGLSYAAQRLGVPADIYLPSWADRSKVRALERHGARLTWFDSVEQARERAKSDAKARGLTFISAYNDAHMIAGGGTVGLEIYQDLPEVDLVVVCVGGGGLAAGVGRAIKALAPRAQVWGVQASNSAKMTQWVKQGHTGKVALQPTIAEGLAVDMEDDTISFPIVQEVIDRFVLLGEDEIRDAVRWLLDEHQLLVEPSGAAPVAALLKERPTGFRRIAAVVTGRNVSVERYRTLIAAAS